MFRRSTSSRRARPTPTADRLAPDRRVERARAARARELLRIVEAGKLHARGQHDGGRDDRARERTDADLVDARHEPRARREQLAGAARTGARRAAPRAGAPSPARSSSARERARAAALVARQEAQPARLARGRDAVRELRAQLGERSTIGSRSTSTSRFVAPSRLARARVSSARTRRSSSGRRESAAISRWKARSRRCGVPSTRAPGGTSLCTPDCGPMNALAPMRRWPAMPACASTTTPGSSDVEPAIPACATMMQCSPIVQLCPICTRLSILVPRPIRVSPSVPRSTRRVRADLDVVLDPRRARRCGILARPPPSCADVAEAVAADHDAGLEHDAIAEHATPPRSRSARGARSRRRRAPRRRARRPGAARVRAPTSRARAHHAAPRRSTALASTRASGATTAVGWMPGAATAGSGTRIRAAR